MNSSFITSRPAGACKKNWLKESGMADYIHGQKVVLVLAGLARPAMVALEHIVIF